MNCPKCGNPIKAVFVRAPFKCKNCGSLLSSNINTFIGTVGFVFFILIVLNSLISYWLFGYSSLVALLSNIAVAIEITIFYLYLLPKKIRVSKKIKVSEKI